MVSLWSIMSGTFWFVAILLALRLLQRNTKFLMEYGVTLWTAWFLLGVLRTLFPYDGKHWVILHSYHVLVAFNRVLEVEPIPGFSIATLLKILWPTGAAIGLIWVLWGIRTNARRLRRFPASPQSGRQKELIKECGLDPSQILVTPAVDSPMTVGVLHPVICLPDGACSDEDLRWILRHEKTHILNRDVWYRLGFLLFRCAFWWNPFVHLAQRDVDQLLELRCDRMVLKDRSEEERLAYVEALYHSARQAHDRRALSLTGTSAFAQVKNAGALAQRAQMAFSDPPRRRGLVTAVLSLSVLLFLASYLVVLQPAGYPPEMEDGMAIYRTTPETSYLKKVPSGGYELWSDGEYVGPIPEGALDEEPYKSLEVIP